jgi:hypothetical protein
MFKLGNLAAPVPVPQGQAGSVDSNALGVEYLHEKRTVDQHNFVEIHMFHYAGNTSVSSGNV